MRLKKRLDFIVIRSNCDDKSWEVKRTFEISTKDQVVLKISGKNELVTSGF